MSALLHLSNGETIHVKEPAKRVAERLLTGGLADFTTDSGKIEVRVEHIIAVERGAVETP